MLRIRSRLYTGREPSVTISHMITNRYADNNVRFYYAFPQADLTNPDLEILESSPARNKASVEWRWSPGDWAGIARSYHLSAHEAAHMYLTKWTMAEVETFYDWVCDPAHYADHVNIEREDDGSYISQYDDVNLRSTTYAERDDWLADLAPSAKAYKYI